MNSELSKFRVKRMVNPAKWMNGLMKARCQVYNLLKTTQFAVTIFIIIKPLCTVL